MYITNGLIPCSTCSYEIGTQAEKCPQCGSPNSWTHPKIKEMLEAKSVNTTRQFEFWHKGAEVWGESVYHSAIAYIGAVIILIIAIFSILFTSIFGPLIGGVFLVLFWRGTAKKDTFKTNIVTGTWESSNDKFWQPVIEFLKQA